MIYTLYVELEDRDLTLEVKSDATRDGMDEDMLQSEMERCLEEQHGLSEDNGVLQVQIVGEREE